MVNNQVVADPIGPGGKFVLEIVLVNDRVDLDKKVLGQLHGDFFIAYHAENKVKHALVVLFHQSLKG